tara:strand:+ start:406 stop:984 length:579 start_codon:yes stop_codon:yes gene_type:complete
MYGESGYRRRANDRYYTQPEVTRALLEAVSFRGRLWEPACGRGDMSKVLLGAGYEVVSTDLYNHGYAIDRTDFLKVPIAPADVLSIVTNPPYTAVEEFIEHALVLTAPVSGMVAMLGRHEFDCAKGRRWLFAECLSFSKKLSLNFRPRWGAWETAAKEKAGPRHNFAWFIWDHLHEGPPTIGWLERPAADGG